MPPGGKENHANHSGHHRAPSSGTRLDFLCRVKHNNDLADIPFDTKFLAYPFEPTRFVQYSATTLERNFKHDLLAEVDLGDPIDLIDPDAYGTPEEASGDLDEIDAMLVEEEATPQSDKKRSRQHAKSVSWLRKTEYISTEYNRFQTSNETPETKLGYNVKKLLQEKDIYKDRQSQIDAIERSFEAAKKQVLRHHTKPGVTAKEVLPVFPDFEMWKFPYAHVVFDTDPALSGRSEKEQLEEMSQATIRGMEDDAKEQFVGFFVPTEGTKRKRKLIDQSGEAEQRDADEYLMAREYNWSLKNKSTKGYEENYFFVFHEEGVFYNELETRVRLNKRRAKKGASTGSSILTVNYRGILDEEVKAQQDRLSQLEPLAFEEEEEEQDFAIAAQQKADIADVFGSSDEDEGDNQEVGEEQRISDDSSSDN